MASLKKFHAVKIQFNIYKKKSDYRCENKQRSYARFDMIFGYTIFSFSRTLQEPLKIISFWKVLRRESNFFLILPFLYLT